MISSSMEATAPLLATTRVPSTADPKKEGLRDKGPAYMRIPRAHPKNTLVKRTEAEEDRVGSFLRWWAPQYFL